MNLLKNILITVVFSVSLSVQAADLSVYWSTDGVASERVHQLAQQFQAALQQETGLKANVTVAKPAAVSAAANQNKADIVITCNEVDSEQGIPLERLSQKAVKSLQCVGGNNKGQWSLAADQDVDRQSTGEYWVYFMRSSKHLSQARDLRAAMQSIRDQLKVEAIITASAM